MNRLLRSLLLVCALLTYAATPTWAVDPCPDTGGTEFLVDTAADATAIAAGYNNTACTIIITVDVSPTVKSWDVFARSFQASSAAQIVNILPLSEIHVTTKDNISVTGGAAIMAREDVHLRCSGAACMVIGNGATLLASESLDIFAIAGDPTSGPAVKGSLTITAIGPIVIENSLIYGGSRVHIISSAGSVTLRCGPVFASPCVSFPCTVTFTSPAAAQAFCNPGKTCGGGFNEFRVTARDDIDITGAAFTILSHGTFESKQGSVLAGGSNITTATDLQMLAFIQVIMTGAHWNAGQTIRVQTKAGCPAGTDCIEAQQADVTGFASIIFQTAGNAGPIDLCAGVFDRVQPGLPSFNGDSSFPYPASVRNTAVDCAPLGPAIIQ